jgi:hypothetical protein
MSHESQCNRLGGEMENFKNLIKMILKVNMIGDDYFESEYFVVQKWGF